MNQDIEHIVWHDESLAYIYRHEIEVPQTTFLTPPETNFQVGLIVYPAGGEVPRHIHLPLQRSVVGTSEVLFVKAGRCLVDFYTNDLELVATREVRQGDILLLVSGGHGFRMLENTVFVEIKQGPFLPEKEKERF